MGGPRWDLKLIRAASFGSSGATVTFYPGIWHGIIGPGSMSSAPSGKETWGIIATFVDHGYASS
jgi:hypothetical protein